MRNGIGNADPTKEYFDYKIALIYPDKMVFLETD